MRRPAQSPPSLVTNRDMRYKQLDTRGHCFFHPCRFIHLFVLPCLVQETVLEWRYPEAHTSAKGDEYMHVLVTSPTHFIQSPSQVYCTLIHTVVSVCTIFEIPYPTSSHEKRDVISLFCFLFHICWVCFWRWCLRRLTCLFKTGCCSPSNSRRTPSYLASSPMHFARTSKRKKSCRKHNKQNKMRLLVRAFAVFLTR